MVLPFDFDESVFFGEGVQVMCHAPKGDTPLTFKWTMNGQDVSSLPGLNIVMAGDRGSVLIIPSAAAKHSGNYTCTVSNVVASAYQHSMLNVKGTSSMSTRVLFCVLPLLFLFFSRQHPN